MAMRDVYEWMLGIRPCLDGLEFAPCIPKTMDNAEVKFEYLGQIYLLKLADGKVFVNNCEITEIRRDIITGNDVFFLPPKRS